MIRQCIVRKSGDVYIGKEGVRHVVYVDALVQGANEDDVNEMVERK